MKKMWMWLEHIRNGMNETPSTIVTKFVNGLNILFYDDCITFYAYFSIILAEIACLWTFFSSIALPFTCTLSLCILNVLVCSYFKGYYEGVKKEVIFAKVYLVAFVALFVIGLFFNWLANIILFIVPLVAVGIFAIIRTFANTWFVGKHSEVIMFVQKVFRNKVVSVIALCFVVGIPYFVFLYFLWQTKLIAEIKIAISLVYAFLIPLICYIEDDFSALTIFELPFDITWDEEYEREMEEFEKEYAENPEKVKEEMLKEIGIISGTFEKMLQDTDDENDEEANQAKADMLKDIKRVSEKIQQVEEQEVSKREKDL